ncbi:MAG TPA: glycosyltransferase [Variovorax sp.]|nr:glycosyltransferase [Variovorax sp.]
MIGVVIPAHNEEQLIGACLDAVMLAARHPALSGEPVEVWVVLDDCADDTGAIVSRHGAQALAVDLRNVGAARAFGASRVLSNGARWLAFTDADSRVAQDWLVRQIELDADVVCGTVAVEDWSPHRERALQLQHHYRATYNDADGHAHVHGANLGVSAAAYQRAGGFAALATSEDVALVEALRASGARIAWSAAPRVATSARRVARAPLGFAAALCSAADALFVASDVHELCRGT